MKLIRTGKTRLCFHLAQREQRLLLQLLKLYPRVPATYPTLSRSGRLPEPEANQRLLNEALAEQRAENQQRVQALLADPRRLRETEGGWHLSLTHAEVEWLLQLLNDIRVGSWIRLGSPDETRVALNEATAAHVWAMELSGYFQAQLLEAVGGAA